MAKKTVAAKKRNVKVDANGQLHVHSSFNNIIVSLANSEGQIISWSSAGKMGFRGSKTLRESKCISLWDGRNNRICTGSSRRRA